jgi:hypothetical protein
MNPVFLFALTIFFLSALFSYFSFVVMFSGISYFCSTWIFRDTARHVEQLVVFGGFTDTQFLERSLVKQFNELEER